MGERPGSPAGKKNPAKILEIRIVPATFADPEGDSGDGIRPAMGAQGLRKFIEVLWKKQRIRDGAPRRRDGRTEQEWFKAIKNNLTMESLILAQDER